ncbi:hypothetical protein ACFFF7_11860 [Novosphingobium aquiterrae]|uniref:Lipoprotein n=1 Tax=Novosphingobium aquiterrae TaxID=624388 RepID=A0ABV6PM68_9SPHN
MKPTSVLALAAMLALAACSNETPAPVPSEDAATFAPPPPAASEPAAPTATPTAAPSGPVAAAAFPAAMLGRWGLVPADCTSQRGDNKGMITVSAREIRFYESVARIDKVKDSSENRMRATLAYDGEGMQWSRDAQFEVKSGAGQLVLQEYGDDAVPGPRTYTRCK